MAGGDSDASVVLATAGDIAVGKTCLVVRFGSRVFPEGAQPTIGVDCLRVSRPVEGKPISFSVFDTSGDEKYHSVTRSFYRGRDAIVLVYDLLDLDTLESVRDFWLPTVLSTAAGATVLAVIGTKSDALGDGRTDLWTSRRERILADIREALGGRSASFIHQETSAKSGENVDDAFAAITKEVLRVRAEHETTGVDGGVIKIDGGKSASSGCCSS